MVVLVGEVVIMRIGILIRFSEMFLKVLGDRWIRVEFGR